MKKIIEFNFYKNSYKIIRTNHLYEKRNNSKYTRDYFINEKIYVEIFKKALNHGLTSFRNTDIIITSKSYNNNYYLFLCQLKNSNEILVKTVFYSKKNFWKDFKTIKNRIFINNYIIPKLTEIEMKNKILDNIDYDIKDENKLFTDLMLK